MVKLARVLLTYVKHLLVFLFHKKLAALSSYTLCDSPEICQGKKGLHFFDIGANTVVEHYVKRIKILHGCPFEG